MYTALRVCVLCVMTVFLICGNVSAVDFGRDDSGNMKFTMHSIPFLDEEKEGEEKDSPCPASDDDSSYTIDSIGRKVPTATHRSGSAISTR